MCFFIYERSKEREREKRKQRIFEEGVNFKKKIKKMKAMIDQEEMVSFNLYKSFFSIYMTNFSRKLYRESEIKKKGSGQKKM